ncbi:FecR family protein [Thermomonas sp.]|uniref:FecR family protein n=1 Tax=Thermomonas sp. TaxID=1971895 RepID=UPI00391B090F
MADDSRDIERAAAAWLARRDGAQWMPDDEQALQAWLATSTAHRVAFLRLEAAWQESGRLQALGAGWRGEGPPPRGHWQASPADRCEQMLQAVPQRLRAARTPRQWRHRVAAAAVAACALAAAWGWNWHQHAPAEAARYQTALGEIRTLSLADGSHATLASASGIDVRLSPRARDVALTSGEAIFEVAKDPRRPFAVAAEGYRAVAVGTRFSVRRDERDLRVVVTEGTVRLETPSTTAGATPSVLLPAGSVALVRGGALLVRSLPLADAQRLLDWREGLLAFRDAPLSEVAAEFNRYNARKLVVADAEAGALRVGGSFRWDNAEGFVRLLEAGFPVRAEVGADRIVLHSR